MRLQEALQLFKGGDIGGEARDIGRIGKIILRLEAELGIDVFFLDQVIAPADDHALLLMEKKEVRRVIRFDHDAAGADLLHKPGGKIRLQAAVQPGGEGEGGHFMLLGIAFERNIQGRPGNGGQRAEHRRHKENQQKKNDQQLLTAPGFALPRVHPAFHPAARAAARGFQYAT